MVMAVSGEAETVTLAEPLTPDSVAWIWAEPAASAVAPPLLPAAFDTETVVLLVDDQVAEMVTSAVLPSEYFPVAVKACVPPTLGDQLAGTSAMDTRVGDVTVTVVLPLMVATLAEMVAVPAATAFTITPVVPEVTDAMAALLLAQVACAVTSLVVPSA